MVSAAPGALHSSDPPADSDPEPYTLPERFTYRAVRQPYTLLLTYPSPYTPTGFHTHYYTFS